MIWFPQDTTTLRGRTQEKHSRFTDALLGHAFFTGKPSYFTLPEVKWFREGLMAGGFLKVRFIG